MAPTSQQIIKDVSLLNQNLTTEKAEVIIAQLQKLVALNLSHNRLNNFPRGLPHSLVALDLSYNKFRSPFETTRRLSSLVELKITNNLIDNTTWLSAAVSLEYLDLSQNRITVICGLELLLKLKLLHLDNNIISSPTALRLLSLNKNLVDLSLQGNPVCVLKNYQTMVMGFVGTLKNLDGKAVKHRSRKMDVGYSDSYLPARRRNSTEDDDDDENVSMSYSHGSRRPTRDSGSVTGSWSRRRNSGASVRSSASSVPRSIASGERLYADGWSTGADQDPLSMVRPRSPVPWRNPPQIVPRDRKGNLVLNTSGISGGDLSRIMLNTSGASRSFYSNAHDTSFVSSSVAAHQHGGASRDRGRSASPSGMSRSRPRPRSSSRTHAPVRPSSHHTERRGSPSPFSRQTSTHDSRYDNNSNSHSHRHSPRRGSPERQSPSSPQHWSSPALQRKNPALSILKKLPLSPPRPSRAQSASRSVLDESSVSASAAGRDASYYDHTDADAPDDDPDKNTNQPSLLPDDDYFENIGSRIVAGGGTGSDVSSALAFLEEMWHEELIAEAKAKQKEEQRQEEEEEVDENAATVSTSLQNRSALLRAIYNAERLRERKVGEREEERRRLPPPALHVDEVDWDHHHSGGKTPPYHRMSFRKDYARRSTAGGGSGHGTGDEAEMKGGMDEEKYEKILSRAKGFGDALSGESPPSSAAVASCRDASSVLEQSARISGGLKPSDGLVDTYTGYDEDEGESCALAMGLDEGGQRKYQVPLPHLPILNRSKESPDQSRRRTTSQLQRESLSGTGTSTVAGAGAGGFKDVDPMSAELLYMHRAFGDLEGLGDFDELEKLLISSQDADATASGVSAGAGGGGADEIARLRTVMQAIMERRKESISLLQKSIAT